MARDPLADIEIKSALAGLPGWEHAGDSLRKTFQFGSFREAISFLIRVAFEAEQLNHHPEIENVYSRPCRHQSGRSDRIFFLGLGD